MNNIILMAAWFATRSSPVYKWWVKLVDDSGKAVIRSLQDMTEPANTTLNDGMGDIRLAGLPTELVIRHKIGHQYIGELIDNNVFRNITSTK